MKPILCSKCKETFYCDDVCSRNCDSLCKCLSCYLIDINREYDYDHNDLIFKKEIAYCTRWHNRGCWASVPKEDFDKLVISVLI